MLVIAKVGPNFRADAASVESVLAAAIVVLVVAVTGSLLLAAIHRYGSRISPH